MVLKILVLWVVFNITVDLNTYPTMEDSAKAIEGCIYTLGVLQWSVCSMIWSADRMVLLKAALQMPLRPVEYGGLFVCFKSIASVLQGQK